MDPTLPVIDSDLRRSAFLASVEDLVMAETPSDDLAALRAGYRVLARMVSHLLGDAPESVEVDGRPHLRFAPSGHPRLLVLGHLDTVWPLGTTRRWPFRANDTTATGPGIFDMKAGLVQALHAMSAARRPEETMLLVTSDAEIGSTTSRSLIEATASQVEAVLVVEPSSAGALKTARKGVSFYQVRVNGRATHAGLQPEAGVNALVELAYQVSEIAQLADPDAGTTVVPTTARAGTTVNTVPADAVASVDVRAWTDEEQRRVDAQLRQRDPLLVDAKVTVTGGVNRPPLKASASGPLAATAQRLAADLGLGHLPVAAVGGASDGNFTGALGVPTLDGCGAVGGNAHVEGEWIDIEPTLSRIDLLRALIDELRDPVALPRA